MIKILSKTIQNYNKFNFFCIIFFDDVNAMLLLKIWVESFLLALQRVQLIIQA